MLLVVITAAVVDNGPAAPPSTGHPAGEIPIATVATTPSPGGLQTLTAQQHAELQQSISRMRAVVPVEPATSPIYPAVSAEARQQPDLYAAAFVRQLLTQNYSTDRNQLLAWVQSESAQSTDPLVVGLPPIDLRRKLAVASIQDDTQGPSPVPSQSEWVALARLHGHTTAQITHVTEPVSWASAVANGQITDPGVTARRVDAEVTSHTTNHGKATAERYSVALVVNLEGPPARNGYGFVTAITYNVAALGRP